MRGYGSFSATSLLVIVGASGATTLGCGSDHQTRSHRDDDIIDRDSPLDPIGVPEQCEVSANCEDGDRCTEDRCIAFACVSIPIPSDECCDAVTLFEEDFDGALDPGVELTALNDEAGWSVVEPESPPSPPGVLYFGDPLVHSYDKGVQVAGSVTLPPIDLPTDRESVLSMRLYAPIEPSAEFDLFWVEADIVRDAATIETRQVFGKRDVPFTAFQDYALVDVPLTGLEGERVVLRLRFDTLDGNSNAYEGVYLDDLKVQGLCPLPPPCTTDEDCKVDDPCVAAACSPGVGCVETDVCGGDPCAVEGAPEDCCTSDADCDDGDPRTLDVCEGASCVHNPNPDACSDDAACDDGEVCTTDRCDPATATCTHAGTIGPDCCVPGEIAIADFDQESLQGLYVTDNTESGVYWRTDRTRHTSGEFGLYCGDPVSQTYAIGERVKSSATTRPLSIPKGGLTYVGGDLFDATRPAKNWDVFQVMVLRDGALFPLWSSRQDSDDSWDGRWRPMSIELRAYAGQDVQLRFVFDSVDGLAPPLEGVYLDSLRLYTVCE